MILCITGIGCEEENDLYWEIKPDSKTSVIEIRVDGISYKFCLLNEAGEAATVFDEGENFSFYFSVTNNRNEDFYFDPDYARSNKNGFCRVHTTENSDLGKPYELLYALLVGSPAYPFYSGDSYVFEVPWRDDRDSVWFWQKGTYESTHRELLEKGSYYTGFKYSFDFVGVGNEPDLRTDTLGFSINFKIR